jgi:hypothetical protein
MYHLAISCRAAVCNNRAGIYHRSVAYNYRSVIYYRWSVINYWPVIYYRCANLYTYAYLRLGSLEP